MEVSLVQLETVALAPIEEEGRLGLPSERAMRPSIPST
jgi:hypothetical protein